MLPITTLLMTLAAAPASQDVTVWLGRTQAIAISVDAVYEDVELAVEVEDTDVLELLRAPRILAGETGGYARVRGAQLGRTNLRVGDSVLEVDVREPLAIARVHQPECRITAPVNGARVSGRCAVGVELGPGFAPPGGASNVRLRLSNGTELEPPGAAPKSTGPARTYIFEIDAEALQEGVLELHAVASPAGGDPIISAPVRITIVHPAPEDVFAVECETVLEDARPGAFGAHVPLVGFDPEASGEGFVVNASADPVWCVPFEVERAGAYQAFVVARGDFAAGAYPSVGICLDRPGASATVGRLLGSAWHRVPVGRALLLGPGQHAFGVRFLNDRYVPGTADRNLFLDRFELVRSDFGDEPESSVAEAGMSMQERMTSRAEDGASGRKLFVAWERPVHGLPVNGRLELRGWCRWEAPGQSPAPRVDLFLNDTLVASQQAARPIFTLDRSAFSAGANRLRMVASLPDGRRAEAPEQTVHVTGEPGGLPARAFHRFSVVDERWNADLRAKLVAEENEPGHSFARLDDHTRAEFPLPDDLVGDYEVFLEARGPDAPAAAALALALNTDAGEERIADLLVSNWWENRAARSVSLAAGSKSLVLFRSEEAPAGELQLRSVMLRAKRAGEDRHAPRVHIRYPAPDHVAHGIDAVVAEAWDDERLTGADLLIDGQPAGTYGHVPQGAGHLVLPLILRDVSPGEHSLSVRVYDATGNVGQSRTLRIFVAGEEPPAPGPYARAVRLLNRFAYGPEPRELTSILTQGEEDWLRERLAAPGPGDAAALGAAVTHATRLDNPYAINQAAVLHLVRTDNPVRARFTQWLENHFSTWVQKSQADAEWTEYLELVRLGPAPFIELLAASATSPAMLSYLDQVRSTAGQLNENYAREILELHTLGVNGRYAQDDVTRLAGLLAGLTVAEEGRLDGLAGYLEKEFRFDPGLGDGEVREILGQRLGGRARADRFDEVHFALEVLAAHPDTARHVSRSLAEHYVATPPPENLVDDLATVYARSGGDMREMLVVLADHEAFWTSAPRVASPLDYALRLVRSLEEHRIDWAVTQFLDRAGMTLFDRSTPDGYPEEDDAWGDSNGMLQRWTLAGQAPWAFRQLIPGPLHGTVAGEPDARRQRLLDVAAVRLTGFPLGPRSNAAALEYVASLTGPVWERGNKAAVLVTRLPEASMR